MARLPTIGQDPRVAAVELLAGDLARLMGDIEWAASHRGHAACPECLGVEGSDSHNPACRLQLVLRRAAELGLLS